MKVKVCLLFLLFAFALPAAAQSDEPPKVTITGAFSLVRTSLASPEGDNEKGWSTSAALRLSQRWAGRFDLISINSPGSVRVLAGGPEYRFKASKFLPSSATFNAERMEVYTHILVGAARQTTPSYSISANFAVVIGGGLDLKVDDNVAVRLFQVQYIHSRIVDGQVLMRNHLGITTGVALRF